MPKFCTLVDLLGKASPAGNTEKNHAPGSGRSSFPLSRISLIPNPFRLHSDRLVGLFTRFRALLPAGRGERTVYLLLNYYTAGTLIWHPKKTLLSALSISPVVATAGVLLPATGFMNTMKADRLLPSFVILKQKNKRKGQGYFTLSSSLNVYYFMLTYFQPVQDILITVEIK